MRFSPVLLAVLTASTTLVSIPVRAQTSDPIAVSPASADNALVLDNTATQPGAIAPFTGSVAHEPEVLGLEQAASSDAVIAQTPVQVAPGESDVPGAPPAGTPGPGGQPDEVEVQITPSPPIDFDVQPPAPQPNPPIVPPTATPEAEPEPRVLVSEVVVSGATGELELTVYNAIQTRPGQTTTRSQLQQDINAIFATGFFSNVRAVPEDTPLGVRITYDVQPNPQLTRIQLEGNQVETLTYQGEQVAVGQVVDDIFQDQYGRILNLRDLQAGVEELNEVYQASGFVLFQVIDSPQVSPDGTVTLAVAEGVIEDIQVRFLNRDGEATDEDGEAIRGRTREFIITREFEAQPGDVFNRQQIEADLQRVFGLGIFEDVRVSLNPGTDPRQVDVIVNVTERNTGSIAAGAGFSSASGLFGTLSYQEQNLGGNNQRLGVEVQIGQRERLFDIAFTDPWIAGDPYRTSYTVNIFNRQSISLIFDGGEREVRLPDEDEPNDPEAGDRPRVNRLGGGVTFGRPLGNGWRASLGAQYQRVSIRDSDGDISPVDALGNQLSFNDDGTDDLFLVQFAASRDRRNNATQPTSGSFLRFSTEQSVPVGSILLNRLRGSYSHYIPVRFTNFTEGPQTLAFNIQGGTVLGDLPPYEAFSLGGTDSVRGYDSGDLGSGRSFLQATVEYRFPLFAIIGGALFVDVGTDLGTASDVPGEPSVVRDKPGSGFGYGAGIRVQSPLGAIRIDYAINDQGDSRIHFGLGERF